MPTVSLAGFFGMFLATMSSILESMGDYYAAARVSGAPPPPQHAVNRGIAIEGLSSVISGMIGAGHATTSYSGNVAAIAVTRVGFHWLSLKRVILILMLIFCRMTLTLMLNLISGNLVFDTRRDFVIIH